MNNCIAAWRSGAWNIQELPFLALKNVPMAGTTLQPPQTKNRHLSHWHVSGKKKGREGGGKLTDQHFWWIALAENLHAV